MNLDELEKLAKGAIPAWGLTGEIAFRDYAPLSRMQQKLSPQYVLKLVAIARQAENLLAYNEYAVSDNAKHSAKLLREALRELKGG